MRSLFHEIHITVERTLARSGFTKSRILGILGIQRSWYYRQVDPGHITDGRFNPFAVRDDEWIVMGYKRRHPRMKSGRQTSCTSSYQAGSSTSSYS